MNMLGLGGSATIDINFDNLDKKKMIRVKDGKGDIIRLPLYTGNDGICGTVDISLGKTKKLEHQGVRVELVGRIESSAPKVPSSDFMSMSREVEPAGILTDDKKYTWAFNNFEKDFETYSGLRARLRYFVRVTIQRKVGGKLSKEKEFAVLLPDKEPEDNDNIKMDVGIEECLHIEFEYNKGKYHLKDCVIGKVYFALIRVKIKSMEISLVRQETFGSGANSHVEKDTIGTFEVMDGCPNKGEIIPIRLYLAPYELTPSFKNVSNKFSVKYFLKLTLIDDDDRKYFKQQEIVLWRKSDSKKMQKKVITPNTDLPADAKEM